MRLLAEPSAIQHKKLQFCSKRCVFLGYSDSHKGFKCLDPSEGRVYISRDIVFDEHVFPFAHLHPNAGAQLRAEIALLPPSLLPPSSTFGDAILLDQNSPDTVSTNPDSSSPACPAPVEKNPVEIDAQTTRPADDEPVRIRRHFMCFPGGDSTTIEDTSAAGTATASSSGSVPPVLEPGLSFVRIPNSGSSAAEARTASHTNSVGSGVAA